MNSLENRNEKLNQLRGEGERSTHQSQNERSGYLLYTGYVCMNLMYRIQYVVVAMIIDNDDRCNNDYSNNNKDDDNGASGEQGLTLSF